MADQGSLCGCRWQKTATHSVVSNCLFQFGEDIPVYFLLIIIDIVCRITGHNVHQIMGYQ